MRLFLTSLMILITLSALAQTAKKVDSLEFCHIKLKVPQGCAAKSKFQVKCDGYSMAWIYMTPEMLQSMPEQFVNKLPNQLKDVNTEKIQCYLFNNEVKGYKISFQISQGIRYQLIAYGVVNDQPVLAQLLLGNEPKTNEDIPAFPRQIIRLTK
jgi:hypothetical protein